jgi:hypothetical protein
MYFAYVIIIVFAVIGVIGAIGVFLFRRRWLREKDKKRSQTKY